jgi:hypothetical protein
MRRFLKKMDAKKLNGIKWFRVVCVREIERERERVSLFKERW